ncbi:MAG: helix-turn-helix domain-containing protein [Vicinamibacteraceae bacterium]
MPVRAVLANPDQSGQPDAAEIERRIAARLAQLRTGRGWSLDVLAESSGISRATLSRLERGELSPTAAMLGRLCTTFGWTLSRLMAEAETRAASVIPAAQQTIWTDPDTGYQRRMLSPPGPGLRGELVEIRIPAGASVAYDTAPVPGLEHHLWLLEGALTLAVDGTSFQLQPGDVLRYLLTGPSRFTATGRRPARYVIGMVHP